MSTASEIGRMPAAVIRRTMKSGVGAAGSKPVTLRATKTGQPSASSTTTGWPSALAAGVSRIAGSRKPLAPSTDTSTSRAMPRIDRAYARSGLISNSMVSSSSPRTGRTSWPGSPASAGSTMMPSWSSPRPSSAAEQIIPADRWP